MVRRAPVDDLAEFLTNAYTEIINACEAQGWVAHFVFGPAAHTLIVYDVLAGPVEVSDAGRPLPGSPADIDEWSLFSRVGSSALPAHATPRALVAAIAVLLAAGR